MKKSGVFNQDIAEKLGRPYTLSKPTLRLLRAADIIGLSNIGWHKVLKKNNAFGKRLDRPYLQEY